jgi:tetratricopeptide (TPR) repeat protein
VKGYIRKGYALLALKEYNRAQTAFQKAMEIDENNQVFNYKLLFYSIIFINVLFKY